MAVKALSYNHWTARKIPAAYCFKRSRNYVFEDSIPITLIGGWTGLTGLSQWGSTQKKIRVMLTGQELNAGTKSTMSTTAMNHQPTLWNQHSPKLGCPFSQRVWEKNIRMSMFTHFQSKIEINFASSRQALFLIFGPCVSHGLHCIAKHHCQEQQAFSHKGMAAARPFNILWYTVVYPHGLHGITWIYMVYNLVLTRLNILATEP